MIYSEEFSPLKAAPELRVNNKASRGIALEKGR